jgi:hypothetical protein
VSTLEYKIESAGIPRVSGSFGRMNWRDQIEQRQYRSILAMAQYNTGKIPLMTLGQLGEVTLYDSTGKIFNSFEGAVRRIVYCQF